MNYNPPPNKLPFPLNLRFMIAGWNLLFFRPAPALPVDTAGKSAQWNRGAYIVNGLGHCGACHTPKNALGADRKGVFLQGGDSTTGWRPTSPPTPAPGWGPGAPPTSSST